MKIVFLYSDYIGYDNAIPLGDVAFTEREAILILSALVHMDTRWKWRVTDAEWDEMQASIAAIEAKIAQA